MSNTQSSYTSCIKIAGTPIIPPLITPKIRQQCQQYRRKAIDIERQLERNKLFAQCMEDFEKLETKTKELNMNTLENQLALAESSPSHVPYETYTKMRNLTTETIDVSEYSEGGVKVLSEDVKATPKLIRSNSYTLESPSPILLAHLQKEAQKCVSEIEDSESRSLSPVTIIGSVECEPPLRVVDTDVVVEQVTITTDRDPKGVDPQLLEILEKLPPEHSKNILEILSKQQENHKVIKEIMGEEDKSISVSISSQSLYFSTLSPDSTRGSPAPDINVINLRNARNGKMGTHRAASIIQAYVRGYLVRRMFRTEKVQSLIDTIKDALLCAIQLHGADVIEEADVELHRRLIQQVSAACYAFHDIFFTLSTREQMGLIALDRTRKLERAKRPLSGASSNLSVSRRQSARSVR